MRWRSRRSADTVADRCVAAGVIYRSTQTAPFAVPPRSHLDTLRSVPIPGLTADGLLPPGIHQTTLDDIGLRFGSSNDRRQELFEKLQRFVALVRGFNLMSALVVDGSFVTSKPVPGDVDVVLLMPRANLGRLLLHPNALQLSKSAVKAAYEVHLFTQQVEPMPPDADMTLFFQRLRTETALLIRSPIGARKGILKVDL